jgi:chaperonin cofactor prefoldin
MAEPDDQKDNQLVTRRLLNAALRAVGEAVGKVVNAKVADPIKARLDALEKRIAALEDKPS